MARKSTALEKVERIVRNLPIVGIEYLKTKTEHGWLYIAFGREAVEDVYHGIYAFDRGPGIAQTMEFKKGTSRDDVMKALEAQGFWLLDEMNKRQLLTPGVFNAHRR